MFWDSRIDSEFRKVWQILNRFCCKVKSCLGISSQGNPDLVLNQQGNWIETQSYKVYTALLTQSGGDSSQQLYSGAVTKGVTYKIKETTTGDFSNVGAPNNNVNTIFVATNNEIPNSYGGGNLLYNTGAPVVTVLENTIGNIWFTYDAVGVYRVDSDGLFTTNKTSAFIQTGNNGTAELLYSINTEDANVVSISTSNIGPTGLSSTNGCLVNTAIEIRVYN